MMSPFRPDDLADSLHFSRQSQAAFVHEIRVSAVSSLCERSEPYKPMIIKEFVIQNMPAASENRSLFAGNRALDLEVDDIRRIRIASLRAPHTCTHPLGVCAGVAS
jgi:hypothetical protein